MIRFYPIISRTATVTLTRIGLITMVMSGLGANLEADAKKLIALSTLRQLGMIIIILGAGLPGLAFFHLVTHALFKSSLFICAGFIIHSRERTQDSRLISRFAAGRPGLSLGLLTTNLALCGIPFLAGFFSKDIILEKIHNRPIGALFSILALIGVGATVAYRLRLIYKTMADINKFIAVEVKTDFRSVVTKRIATLLVIRALGGLLVADLNYWATPGITLTRLIKYTTITIIVITLVLSAAIFFTSSVKINSDERLAY